MEALLFADVGTKILSGTLGGSAFSWPKLIQEDDVRISLRFTKRVNGEVLEVDRTVESLRVTLGRDDARPTWGKVRLKVGSAGGVIGSNVTAEIPFNATEDEVASAFDALTDLTEDETPVDVRQANGSWHVTFADGSEKTISLYETSLFPVSFLRFRVQTVAGKAVHEIRFTQAPLALTTSWAAVVPPEPTITALRDGGSEIGVAEWNEVQRLRIPPEFRGTFQIARGFKKTDLLSVEDGVEEIAEALKKIADDDGVFLVTNPTGNDIHIEFSGTSMEGQNQDLLVVSVYDAPPGDPTFTLSLNTAELSTLLNNAKSEKLPLEIHLVLVDEQDEELTTKNTFRSDVEVIRKVGFEGMAEAQDIDHIRPPLPRNYVPFTVDQINSGILHYSTTFGDGAETEFTFDHNLASESVLVLVRLNTTPGAVLRAGTDYALEIASANSIDVNLLGDYLATPPAVGALAVTVLAMGQASQFQPHTHTKAQVEGLVADLEALQAAVAALQAATGLNISPGNISGSSTGPTMQTLLRRLASVYPMRKAPAGLAEAVEKATAVSEIPLALLPRTGGLLPAVHDAATEALPDPLPTAPEAADANKVYENQGAEFVLLPGSYGRKTVKLLPGEFAALLLDETTGRLSWYRVAKLEAAESTFYPTDFDKELFVLPINDAQLRIGKKLTVEFGLEAAILGGNSLGHYILRIEHGSASEKAAPGTPGPNLDEPVWNTDEPILEHRFHITPDATVHRAGCVITRTAAETLTATALLYDATQGAGSAPPTANFFLRARLVGFDTQDNEGDPRGFVALIGLNRALGESEDSDLGQALITSA